MNPIPPNVDEPPSASGTRPTPATLPAILALRARWKRPAWQRGLVPLALAAGGLFLLARPTPTPLSELPTYHGRVRIDAAMTAPLDSGARARAAAADGGSGGGPRNGPDGGRSGGNGDENASSRDAIVLLPGARFEFELRPAEPVRRPVGPVRGWRVRDGQAVAWQPPLGFDATGVVRATGLAGQELPPETGHWTLVFTLGAAAPEGIRLVKVLGAGLHAAGPGWQAVGFAVEIR